MIGSYELVFVLAGALIALLITKAFNRQKSQEMPNITISPSYLDEINMLGPAVSQRKLVDRIRKDLGKEVTIYISAELNDGKQVVHTLRVIEISSALHKESTEEQNCDNKTNLRSHTSTGMQAFNLLHASKGLKIYSEHPHHKTPEQTSHLN